VQGPDGVRRPAACETPENRQVRGLVRGISLARAACAATGLRYRYNCRGLDGVNTSREENVVMRKQWVLVGIVAVSLLGSPAQAQHKAPNQQPATAAAPTAPTGELALGSVRLPRAVTADGKPLPAGTYQVRLTAQEAKPQAVGTTQALERWVEFVQKGTVKGREVVSIVPQAEAKTVAKDAPPPSGGSKVQTLKGNEYVRVWINKAGNYYLIHLPTGAAGN
jgi:hypothetical protein